MKKRILSLFLAAALACGLAPAAFAAGMDNFGTAQTYPAGKFTDVSDGAWYAQSVQTAYELGLVAGVSDTAFNPEGSITIGSTVALAARLHSIYTTGSADFTQGSPWYAVYVNYAVDNGILTLGQFNDYNANATRRQFAGILAKALPAEALEAVNTVEDGAIPDVAAGSENYEEIYTLYRAGVLTGSDDKGTFAPETTIDRASVAAIVSRMAEPELRQSITLIAPEIAATAVTLSERSLELDAGESVTLTAAVTPANASDKTVTWSSSNESVAAVAEDGTVTAGAGGTATITATAASGVSASCTVTVTSTVNEDGWNLRQSDNRDPDAVYPDYPDVPDFGAIYGLQRGDMLASEDTYTYEFYIGPGGFTESEITQLRNQYLRKLTSEGFSATQDTSILDSGGAYDNFVKQTGSDRAMVSVLFACDAGINYGFLMITLSYF